MSISVETVGKLSLVRLSDREKEVLLEVMREESGDTLYEFISFFLGEDFLKFLDTFSGQRLNVPDRDRVVKLVNYVKIYAFVEKGGFSEEVYDKAALLFEKRRASVVRIVAKLNRILDKLKEGK